MGKTTHKEKFNKAKFKELLLCIASKSESDERFGSIKLNKILYYSDFFAYRLLGHSITGADYMNLSEGPAPKQLLTARAELKSEGLLDLEYRPYFNGIQQRPVAKRGCNEQLFETNELSIVNQVIRGLWPFNGKEVSDISHREYGWKLTNESEIIPYRTAWLSSEPLAQDQIEYGIKLAEALNV
jgi:uncharacterized phage-associated protein